MKDRNFTMQIVYVYFTLFKKVFNRSCILFMNKARLGQVSLFPSFGNNNQRLLLSTIHPIYALSL